MNIPSMESNSNYYSKLQQLNNKNKKICLIDINVYNDK